MNNRLEYIDSIRGLAVILVLLVHVRIFTEGLPSILDKVLSLGAKGVIFFYIVSAFTLFFSLDRKKNTYSEFIYKRFFRIAPLFYFALLIYIGVRYLEGTQYSFLNLLSHILFLNGVSPYWINSILNVEWSIAVEMIFYLTVPFLFSKIKNINHSINFIAIGLIINFLLRTIVINFIQIEDQKLLQSYFYYWLPNQLAIFGLGIAFFFVWKDKGFNIDIKNKTTILLFLLGLTIAFYDLLARQELNFIAGLFFFAFVYFLSVKRPRIFVNRIFGFIGTISYSMYLWHFLILGLLNKALTAIGMPDLNSILNFFILFILTIFITIFISKGTYKYIEVPSQKIAKKIISNKRKSVTRATA